VSIPASSASALSSGSPPIADQTLEPAWVRKGSVSTQKAYETALAFEQMLVEQLSQSLTASSGLGGESGQEGESSEGSSGGAGANGPLSSMLPQALTSGVMSAGGLGLAAQMTRQLAGAAASATGAVAGVDGTTGGTSASTGTSAPASASSGTSIGGTSAPASVSGGASAGDTNAPAPTSGSVLAAGGTSA
jgi:Rod binding domain-containing protein